MSTKIYTAYKMKDPAQYWAFVRDVIPRGQANVKEELREMYKAIAPRIDRRRKEYRSARRFGYSEQEARLSVAQKIISKEAKQAEIHREWSPFDVRVEIGVWEHKGQLYMIPFANGFCTKVLAFLEDHPLLDDFCYWNNTDAPEGMTRREWNKRERIWDAIHDAGWQNHTVIVISSHGSLYLIDPIYELEKEARDGKT